MDIQQLSIEAREEESKRYTLTDAESKRIFEEDIKPRYFNSSIKSQDKPNLVMVGGQPAAGKTLPLLKNKQKFENKGGVLIINGDDFRGAHPKIEQIKENHGKDYAFYTDKDSGRWVEMMIKEAQEQKVNVILEGTMRRPEVTLNTAKEFNSNGYDIHANIIAVKPQESWLGVHERFERMMSENPNDARYTQKHSHDVAVQGLSKTVAEIEDSKIFKSIEIADRKGHVLYENKLQGDSWEKSATASKTLSDFHNEPLTNKEKSNLSDRWQAVINQMEQRTGNEKELDQVKQYKKDMELDGKKEPKLGRDYIGQIVEVNEKTTIQKTPTGKIFEHDNAKLDRVPEETKNYKIAYAENGIASVNDHTNKAPKPKEQAQEIEQQQTKSNHDFER